MLEQAHAELPLSRDYARVRLERAFEHAEQGRFASAVSSDEADALVGDDAEAGSDE